MKFFLTFIFGAVIGSFLNVCIYRLPRGESIVRPGSHCPGCGKPIKPFDNIPIISFLLLRGRCRQCGTGISPRYPIVELLTPLAGMILLWSFPAPAEFFAYWLFACILIVVTFIDIDYQLISDALVIPGIFIGLAFSAFFGVGIKDSILGVAAGALSICFMGLVGKVLFPKKAKKAGGAIGGGDIKLMAMMGAFLGWKLVLLTFFMAPVFGSVAGMYVLLKRKENVIPYGPYLSLSAFLSLLYGNKILDCFLYGVSP